MDTDVKEFDYRFWRRLVAIEVMTLSPNPNEANNAALLVNQQLAKNGLTRKDWPHWCREYFRIMGVNKTVPASGRRKNDIGRPTHQKLVWIDVIRDALKELGGEAILEDIYWAVQRRGIRCKTTDILKSQIRNNLQLYSSDAKQHKPNSPDVFRRVKKGVWALRDQSYKKREADKPPFSERPVYPASFT